MTTSTDPFAPTSTEPTTTLPSSIDMDALLQELNSPRNATTTATSADISPAMPREPGKRRQSEPQTWPRKRTPGRQPKRGRALCSGSLAPRRNSTWPSTAPRSSHDRRGYSGGLRARRRGRGQRAAHPARAGSRSGQGPPRRPTDRSCDRASQPSRRSHDGRGGHSSGRHKAGQPGSPCRPSGRPRRLHRDFRRHDRRCPGRTSIAESPGCFLRAE